MAMPLWLVGRNVTLMEVAIQTVASNGTLSDGLKATLTNGSSYGLVDGIEFSASKTTENISSMGQTRAHNVRLTRRDTITVTEVMGAGSSTCLLASIWQASIATAATSRYVRAKFTRGANSWEMFGVLTGYDEGIRRGKSTASLTIQMIDTGAGNTPASNNSTFTTP